MAQDTVVISRLKCNFNNFFYLFWFLKFINLVTWLIENHFVLLMI